MATFQADVVEDMSYDFTKWGGPKGAIPEPTEHGLTSWLKAVDDVYGSTQAEDDLITRANKMQLELEAKKAGRAKGRAKKPDPEPPPVTWTGLFEKNLHAEARLTAAAGELCQNTPSEADIATLPYRVRQAFLLWLVEQYVVGGGTGESDPPAQAAGTTTS